LYRLEWINLLQSPVFLTISDLWIERGEKDLCKGFNLDVRAGEVIRILGANGAGKSSLLKVITGIFTPLEGRINYCGQEITHDKKQLLQNTLYIGHSSGLKNVLTVQENLRYYFPHTSLESIQSVLSLLGIFDLADALVKTLSAGQIRRTALARLWLSESKLWLLDEPFSSLDIGGIAFLEARIKQHVDSGGIVILTTHQALNTIRSREVDLLS